MKLELRRVHHLNEDESRMLLLFRLLPEGAKESMIRLAELQIEATSVTRDNVVSLSDRTVA